ncbi:MAG: adenylate/guanylate cyclase domain-containing protein [Nitratireductor sp.]|nr:adenylate/guanylate cyclase domain-containing protein [Nitratireductor sp.]
MAANELWWMWQQPRLVSEARLLLREAEINVERKVSLLRCAFGLTSIVLFLAVIIPQEAPGSPLQRQTPFIFVYSAAYFIGGCITYYMSTQSRYRAWIAWVFTGADILFWLMLMVSGMMNVGIPANLLVGTPPIFVIFLILSLVSLRSNPALQFAALVSIMLSLVLLALLARSYFPDYPVSGDAVLFSLFQAPQNIVRISIFFLAGLTLVYLAHRTRALLMQAIERRIERTNLGRYLPAQLVDRLVQTNADWLENGVSVEAAVMFVDIRNFTARAESMQPSDLRTFLSEYRAIISASVDSHGGILDKFVGDGAMAVFGAPEQGPDDAVNALDCAKAIRAGIAGWNTSLVAAGKEAVSVGIGIHFGTVFCGAIGDTTRLEFTVLGDTVNVASRLESLTKEFHYPVIASSELLQRVPQDRLLPEWEKLNNVSIRGHARTMELFGLRAA